MTLFYPYKYHPWPVKKDIRLNMSSTDLVKEFVEVLKWGEMDDNTMWRIALAFNDTIAGNMKKEEDTTSAVVYNEKKKPKNKKKTKKNNDKKKV